MSGIAGLIRFNGKPVAKQELERMANTLRAHGPDRSEVLVADTVGFVNVLMRMTPEDRFDRQPLRSKKAIILTADVRLDNRQDILEKIAIPSTEALAWSDSQVLLHAYEKFGDDIWPLLHGPFAVAIWDQNTRVLKLVRDQLGLNVIFWYRFENLFAFATMPKGLFALSDVPRELDENKLADFLVLNHNNQTTTIYKNIYRVPPAHILRISPDGSCEQRRYWSSSEIKAVRLSSDSAYAEGLRDVLDKAVRHQMRSIHPVGCFLSGGLDSSAVATLAAQYLAKKGQRLSAYTQVPRTGFDGAVPKGCYADEAPFVNQIAQQAGNIDVNFIHNDECDDFAELERFFLHLEAPVRNASNIGWMLAINRIAHKQGRRVLLGGLYGNFTISWTGWSQAADHLLAGRFVMAYRQWQQYYSCTPFSKWVAFRKLFLEPIVSDDIAQWADKRRHPDRISPWHDYSAISKDYASEMLVDARAKEDGHDFLGRIERNERSTIFSMVDYVGDWLAAEKAMTGVEVRHPTIDMDVVSYCFGVPPEQYLAENIDRSLIRRAMWGMVPPTVLTNRLSGLQSADWYEKLEKKRTELKEQIEDLSNSRFVRRSIDLVRLKKSLENWPSAGWETKSVIQEYNLALTRGIATAKFLRWIDKSNL